MRALPDVGGFSGRDRDRHVAGEWKIARVRGLRDGLIRLPWQQGVDLGEVGPRLDDGGHRLSPLLSRAHGQGDGPDRGRAVDHHPGDDARTDPLP